MTAVVSTCAIDTAHYCTHDGNCSQQSAHAGLQVLSDRFAMSRCGKRARSHEQCFRSGAAIAVMGLAVMLSVEHTDAFMHSAELLINLAHTKSRGMCKLHAALQTSADAEGACAKDQPTCSCGEAQQPEGLNHNHIKQLTPDWALNDMARSALILCRHKQECCDAYSKQSCIMQSWNECLTCSDLRWCGTSGLH